jgi:hypothetical protein
LRQRGPLKLLLAGELRPVQLQQPAVATHGVAEPVVQLKFADLDASWLAPGEPGFPHI